MSYQVGNILKRPPRSFELPLGSRAIEGSRRDVFSAGWEWYIQF